MAKKITDYAALTTPDGADLLEIVDDVSGTPTSKKITVDNLLALAKPTIGNEVSGGTANRILFVEDDAGTPVLADDANLLWDGNDFVVLGDFGLGTNAPNGGIGDGFGTGHRFLHVEEDSATQAVVRLFNHSDAENTILGTVLFGSQENDGATFSKGMASIRVRSQGSTAANRGGKIQFSTRPDAGSGTVDVHMEIDNAGNIIALNLPTADPAIAGAFWSDSGTLKISSG